MLCPINEPHAFCNSHCIRDSLGKIMDIEKKTASIVGNFISFLKLGNFFNTVE